MNYDQHVAASFQVGFEQRLKQMVVKSAMTKAALDPRALWRMASQAQRAGASLGRVKNVPTAISPKFQMPQVMSTNPNILRNFGTGTTSSEAASRMTGLARGTAGKPFVDPLAAAGRFARGSNLAQAARAGQMTAGYKSPVTGRAMPQASAATPRPVKPIGGFERLSAPLPPGAPPPGAAAGATPPPPGGAPPKPTATSPDVNPAPTPSGDPTGGLLGRIRSMLPGGARAWAERNPESFAAGAGALGGGGAVMAGDQYGDWRRRKAIENLGLMDRLGLAFQLAASPRGFNQTLGL